MKDNENLLLFHEMLSILSRMAEATHARLIKRENIHVTIRLVTRQRMRVAWRDRRRLLLRVHIFRNFCGVVGMTDTASLDTTVGGEGFYRMIPRHHDPVVRARRDEGFLATAQSRQVSRICRKFRVSNKSALESSEKIPFH